MKTIPFLQSIAALVALSGCGASMSDSLVQIKDDRKTASLLWSFSVDDSEKFYLSGSYPELGYVWGGCGRSVELIQGRNALTFFNSCRGSHVYFGPHIKFSNRGNARVEVDFVVRVDNPSSEQVSSVIGMDVVGRDANNNEKVLYNGTSSLVFRPDGVYSKTFEAPFSVKEGDNSIQFRIREMWQGMGPIGIAEVRFYWNRSQ